jgi:Leucine-rich repeat (LRR) protein
VSRPRVSHRDLLTLLTNWMAFFDPPTVTPATATRLRSIHISKELSAIDARALSHHITALTSLTELSLDITRLSSAAIASLIPALQPLSYLRRLGLRLPPGFQQGACAYIASLSQLEDLSISGRNAELGPGGATALAPALGALSNLRRLDLSSNNVGDDGIAALCAHLTSLCALVRLDLCMNDIGPRGVWLAAPFLSCLSHLQELDLGYNSLGPEGISHLMSCLGSMTALAQLSLQSNELGDSGAIALAAHLTSLRGLRSLGLQNNSICDAGAVALSANLAAVAYLRHLDLTDNCVRDVGAAALVQLMHALPFVTLSLRNNSIGAGALAALLARKPKMSSLDVGGNVRPEVCSKICSVPLDLEPFFSLLLCGLTAAVR